MKYFLSYSSPSYAGQSFITTKFGQTTVTRITAEKCPLSKEKEAIVKLWFKVFFFSKTIRELVLFAEAVKGEKERRIAAWSTDRGKFCDKITT